MARKHHSSDVVDGFSVYKAAQKAVQDKKVEGLDGVAGDADPKLPKRIGSHIGRTVLPTKHDIACYQCGYEFQVTGGALNTFCSKCRTHLTIDNHVIDAEWEGELKTAGSVHIKPGGVIKSGAIMAGNVILEGTVANGAIQAFRWLELRPGSTYDSAKMMSRDLRISENMRLILPVLACHHVDVAGTLKAKIFATGLVRIAPTGMIEGEIDGPRLWVEEGGGLRATVTIGAVEAQESGPVDRMERSA